METLRFHPNLAGKNILVIDSLDGGLFRAYEKHMTELERMKVVGVENMPSSWGKTLFNYMSEIGAQMAIIHNFYFRVEVDQILEAHKKGKLIVLLKKEILTNDETIAWFTELEQQGIPTASKFFPTAYLALINVLDIFSNRLK